MPTKTDDKPTFRTSKARVDAGRAWLAAKAAKDAAEDSLKEAREALIKVLPVEQRHDEIAIVATVASNNTLVDSAVLRVGDRVIQVQRSQRREFDVDALDEAVSDFVFAQVTETVVVTSAFDSAVEMGLINEAVLNAVVDTRDVLSLREVKP